MKKQCRSCIYSKWHRSSSGAYIITSEPGACVYPLKFPTPIPADAFTNSKYPVIDTTDGKDCPKYEATVACWVM